MMDGRIDEDILINLIDIYGTKHQDVLAYDRPRRLVADKPFIRAQILYAMHEEMALTLEDVMMRRTAIGTLGYPGDECTISVARIMANHFGWNQAQTEKQIEEFKAIYSIKD